MSKFSLGIKKHPFAYILTLVILIVALFLIVLYKWISVSTSLTNSISIIGTIITFVGFIIVIWQIFELKTRTDIINTTYSKALFNILHSDLMVDLAKARENISNILIDFKNDRVENSWNKFEFLYNFLTELKEYIKYKNFTLIIDEGQLDEHILFCVKMIYRISKNDGIDQASLTWELQSVLNIDTFLMSIKTQSRLTNGT